MMLRASLFLSALSLFATSCSDPVPPPAKAAVSYSVGGASIPATGRNCLLPSHNANIGQNADGHDAATVKRVSDGESAEVSCTVRGSGTYSVSAFVLAAKTSISLRGEVTEGAEGEADISLNDPTMLTTISNPSDTKCKLSVKDAPLQVAPGRLWARFECPILEDRGTPGTSYCGGSGYVLLENCND